MVFARVSLCCYCLQRVGGSFRYGQGLQREHASVENIVRLAMEAGPVIPETEDSPRKLNPFPREAETVAIDDENQALNVVLPLIEKEERKAFSFESLTRQSSLKEEVQPTTSRTGDYVMSTPAAKVRLLTRKLNSCSYGLFRRFKWCR